MTRNRSSKSSPKRRRSVSQIVLFVISLIIVLSMAIGFVLSVLPTPTAQQTVVTPTPIILASPAPGGPATPQSDQ